MKKAFTLIELLIGFALVGLLMATGIVLLFTSLRTAKKASAVGTAKTEGAYALNTLSQKIRYAQSVSCPASPPNSVTVNFFGGTTTVYRLSSGKLAASGASTADLTTSRVVVDSSGCPGGTFTCSPAVSPTKVTICFNVNLAGVTDVNETGKAAFQSQVSLRNAGN